MKRSFQFPGARAVLVCAVSFAIVSATGNVCAQSPGAQQANAAAYDQFAAGKYQEAAAAYAQLLKDYPTDAIVPGAQIQLAFSFFFLGKFDEATAILQKALTGPPLPDELKQVAESLAPQILLAKASLIPASDPKRKAAFEEAIKKLSSYIAAFPKAPDIESSIYSRAVANYQIGNYEEAVKDCELNIAQFPKSGTLPTTRNLLAIAKATQGSILLNKDGTAARDQAFGYYKQASDILRSLIANKNDIALFNEANFQLGEILFNQAGFSDEKERPALYKEALDAYRAIIPKDAVVEFQQNLIASFPEKRRQAVLQRNPALVKQLERDNLRELTKLEELKNKPDQVATATLKMAEIFFQQGKTNEARTLLRHVSPFLQNDDDKKRELYFRTMTYALQNNADKALEGYGEFQGAHKGDALADNLPVTLGNMLLSLNRPQDSIQYFDESLKLYPKGRFTGLSVVSKAAAESRLGQYDSAAKTFQEFLKTNPPPEIAVIAQSGLANVYKDTSKWDDAIAAYKIVKDKFPATPQAIDAAYWVAVGTQQKGQQAEAIPLLDAFVKEHPDHPYTALALYAKATAQLATNAKEDGFATLAEVADKFPDSPPAPFTYFMRAQIRGGEGKADEVVALMKQFIEKYPKDDKVFFAYDSVAQAEINAGNRDGGLATYLEYVQKYPESTQAPDALNKVSDLQRTAAESLGRYGALNEEERAKWKTAMDASIASSEQLLKQYPDSEQLALTLRSLLQAQRLLAAAELKSPKDVETYFQGLADSAASPKAKSKVLFALADFVSESDPARGLTIMSSAYDPAVVYAPADLDVYGTALINDKKGDKALEIFAKLEKDYPIPAGVSPSAAAPLVQQAQAIVLFGKGRVAQESGKTAEAGKFFQQLKTLYPWSPKGLEADYGIAQSLKAEGKFDEALTLLGGVIRAPNATAELRANSMLTFGYIMVEKKKLATDPKEQRKFLDSAIDNFIKIAQFYGGVPQAAAEGLWVGSQLLEEQAASDPDKKFQQQQLDRAKAFYQQLVKDYPNSEFTPKAKERLKALGVK